MNRNIFFLLGTSVVAILLFPLLRDSVEYFSYKIEQKYFSILESNFKLIEDLDKDGISEEAVFSTIRFLNKKYPDEGSITIYKNGKKIFFQENLGNYLVFAKIQDINLDSCQEIISKWQDGNAIKITIFSIKNGFKELLWASGRDVVLADIDNDKIEEVIEYWRNDESTNVNDYKGTIYKWNGQKYVIIKTEAPIIVDPLGGDKVVLGKKLVRI